MIKKNKKISKELDICVSKHKKIAPCMNKISIKSIGNLKTDTSSDVKTASNANRLQIFFREVSFFIKK